MSAADGARPVTVAEARALFAPFVKESCIALAVSGGPDSTALLWLAALVRLGRAGVRRLFVEPPLETLFFFPVGVLFVLAALTENRLITWATFWLALGGWIEVTLFAALLRHEAMRSPIRRALTLVGLVLATVALFLVVIEALGLFPLVVETLRHGPER